MRLSDRRAAPRVLRVPPLTLLVALTLCSPALRAGALTDGTAGRVQSLSGRFTVPQTLGTVNGANLFHSFQSFSVNPGESVTFTTTTALQNVIARVTGGTSSTISGLLKLDAAGGGKPNLFLINPAGVTFSAGSSVDVPGAFHVSTANYLKFADGSVYQSDPSKGGSTFSAAAPSSFGFVGTRTAAIVLQNIDLGFPTGQAVSLTAGDIAISNATLLNIGGNVRLAAVGSTAGELGIIGPLPALSGKLVIDNGAQIGVADGGALIAAAGDIVIGSPVNAAGAAVFSLARGADVGGAIQIHATHGLTLQNGAGIVSGTDRAGNGGNVEVNTGGKLLIGSNSSISAITSSTGDSGSVVVAALGGIVLDGGGSVSGASIGSESTASGKSGNVSVSAGTGLSLVNNARISASTFGAGQGGLVRVEAGSITMDHNGAPGGTGIVSNASGAGDAGAVDVRVAGGLSVVNGSVIQSSTLGSGHAGAVMIHAGGIVLDGRGAQSAFASETGGTGNAGSVMVVADGDIALKGIARISSSSFSPGNAGSVKVKASTITIDNDGAGITAAGTAGIGSIAVGTGNAGTVDLKVTGKLTLVNGSFIQSSTFGPGQAGALAVHAGSISLDGRGASNVTGFASETAGSGNAGSVSVFADGDITIRNGARVSSSSFSSGNAGSVTLSSASLTIGDDNPGPNASGVASVARQTGNAGTIDVAVSGLLSVSDGIISTSTEGIGKAGAVTVNAGSISMRNSGANSVAGIGSQASGTGDAGSVNVTAARALSMVNGATISSSTFAQGAAGSVSVTADTILIDGSGSAKGTSIVSESRGSGKGGMVQVLARDHLSIVNDAVISSSAYSSGNGGLVSVRAGSATLDDEGGTGRTGIGSVAFSGSGAGGSVDVSVTGALLLSHGAEISANTSTAGAAGSVNVAADTISVSSSASINSGATLGSSGRTGDVTILAGHAVTLTNGSISIQNDATVTSPGAVPASTLSVTAPRIDLVGSEITASASGNIAAGNIVISESVMLSARDRSAINTSAVTGRGGSIVLRGGGALLLDHSRLTTSVTGTTNGDGGPISIDSPVIILNSGFLQANTAVASARGGDVTINATAPGILIASGQRLISGGQPVQYGAAGDGPNVIQAARPDGVNGDLRIESPQADLSGSLASLPTPRVDFDALGADVCRVGDGSSLTPVGRGGLRPSYAERVRSSL